MCDVRFGVEVVALEPLDDGVRVACRADGAEQTLDAAFVAGCDGAGSFVRDAIGLPFEGTTYSLRPMLADVRLADARDALPYPRTFLGRGGFRFAVRLPTGIWRIVHLAHGEPRREQVDDAEVHRHVHDLLGPGPAEVLWSSRFRIHVRSAPTFRVGRVLLAGDAAHVHSPASGFGMNGGIQDAHNLAWKLAAALRGGDVDRLLDSYDIERRAVVVEDTSRYTDRITRLFIEAPSVIRRGAWLAVRASLRIPSARTSVLRRTAMLDLRYPASPLLRAGSRAAGVRLPNPLVKAPDGRALRLHDLLRNEPVIIDVALDRDFAERLPAEHVIRVGPGQCEEPTGLLHGLLGNRDGWILVRPDGHVAWARRNRHGMDAAIRRALGRPPARKPR